MKRITARWFPSAMRGLALCLALSAMWATISAGSAWAAGATSLGSVDLPDPEPCPGCWTPALETSWQWQLQFRIDRSFDVDMYDVDGFDVPRGVVARLHDGGAAVVCYISAGSWERWRPDAGRFPDGVLGKPNGWPGERWLDIRRRAVLRPIMERRLDMCARKGFDAVEFDNVDGYANRTGLPLRGRDQLRYNVMLANEAHRRGLSALLKNDLGQIRALLPYFDAALNEQCHQYDECGRLDPFVDAGKAVFGVEYKLELAEFCPDANAHDFNFLKKRLALGPWRRTCRGV
ncbi:MAG: endo alpha-1,4 polygalactosaminidase [Actinomycetota bacterium]